MKIPGKRRGSNLNIDLRAIGLMFRFASPSSMCSYQIRCIVMVQYLGQIYSVYGRHNAKAFLNAKAKVVFALNDLDDAKYISDYLGNKTVRVKSQTARLEYSHSSTGMSHQAQPLMKSSDVGAIQRGKSILLLESHSPILASKMRT